MIKDKIRKIKESRLSENEKIILSIISGVISFKSEIHSYKYPNSIFWEKNGVVLLEQDFTDNVIFVNNDLIWSIFEKKYGYRETHNIIKNVFIKNTNFGNLIPFKSHFNTNLTDYL